MAKMYPKDIPDGTPDSERRVYEALKLLPDGWRVFHGVSWQSASKGAAGDGEADFVLLHRAQPLVILEVKGGRIEVEDGQYISVDRHGFAHVIKNPFKQAVRSKFALAQYLVDRSPDLRDMPVAHAAVFCDATDVPILGPEGPKELTLDRSDLGNILPAIMRVLKRLNKPSYLEDSDVERITRLLAPTEVIQLLLRHKVEEAAAKIVQLTNEQFRILRQIRANRRALIYGAAGTGKTLLASEQARRLAADGFRVLLTCFNRPLADFLAQEMSDVQGVKVASFHQLCWSLARQAHLPLPMGEPDPEWFDEEADELLVDAAGLVSFQVDAVVVDEGQDFAPKWWDALGQLMKDPQRGPFFVFADPHQAIYRCPDAWEPPPVDLIFELFTNCRNTLPIATRVAGVFGDELDALGAPGPEPDVISVESPSDRVEATRKTLVRLIQEQGLKPSQVVVLAASRELVDRLQRLKVVNQSLVSLGETGIVVETFHRFKGLEEDVVVAILPERSELKGDDRRGQARALAYIGLSRPRAHLVVIGTPGALSEIEWPGY